MHNDQVGKNDANDKINIEKDDVISDSDIRATDYFGCLPLQRDREVCFHTLLWSLPILLKYLPLDQLILAVGCALSEMKIVVLSPDNSVVSGCLLALVHLLRPMRWSGNIVVTLPSFLNELLGEQCGIIEELHPCTSLQIDRYMLHGPHTHTLYHFLSDELLSTESPSFYLLGMDKLPDNFEITQVH